MLWSKRFLTTVKALDARFTIRWISLTSGNFKTKAHRQLAGRRQSAYSMGPPPSLLQLTVLGNGHLGTPKSVVVRSERQVYIFNCGEGTQRSLVEFSGGVGKIEHIFFTGNSWDHVGGSVGMFLTLKDAKSTNVTFHGPRNVGNLIPFFRDCEFDAGVKTVDNIAFSSQTDGGREKWSDEQVTIRHIPLADNDGREDAADSFAYVIDPIPLKPKLDMFKAMQLKIPKGPLLGKLVDGESVTLDDGRVVTPEEVTLPAATCGSVAIVDLARKDQMAALKKHPAWKEMNRPAVVVHLTPDHLITDDDYVEWANSLAERARPSGGVVEGLDKPGVVHLLVSAAAKGFPSFSSARQQFKLNRVEPSIFPLLPHQTDPTTTTTTTELSARFTPASLLCKPGFQMMVRPPEDWSALVSGGPRNAKLVYDEELFKKEIEEETPDLDEAIDDMKRRTRMLEGGREGTSPWPQVVFLGTTSAIPLKDRNVSGILVRRSETASVILDCGEGTAAQLRRRYGDGADQVFRSINLIFISHNHTDHHIGLPGLILARRLAFEKVGSDEALLHLVIPARIKDWLVKFNDDIVRVLDKVRVVTSQDIFHSRCDPKIMTELKKGTKLRDIQVCYVHHCSQAFGVALVDDDGWKLTFSGDTKPCENLVKMGEYCDLLIHEATMEDGWETEAEKKRHSTTSQAIQVGKSMNARLILLTHFSGRYKMIPLPGEESLDNVGLAFDFASFRFLRDAKRIPLVIKPLQVMFAKNLEENQERSFKRQMRIEDELLSKKQKVEEEEKADVVSNGNTEEEEERTDSVATL